MLRNIVAHHSRLWYRIFPKKPTNLKGHRDKWLASDMTEGQKQRAFGPISALLYLCNAIFPENNIPVYQLGFTKGWRENPIWK